jgi:hypothetical protein
MKRVVGWVLAVCTVLALTAFSWLQWGRSMLGDDYDYAAAFEAQAPGSTAAVVKIGEIVGKTPDELRATLGAPLSCEASLYSTRCSYSPGATEVVFIDGRADWITVKALGETKLDPAALPRIGLPQSKPKISEPTRLVWTDIEGLREVQAVGDGDQLEFIRVKALH